MRSPTRLNFVLTGFLLAAAFACQTGNNQSTADYPAAVVKPASTPGDTYTGPQLQTTKMRQDPPPDVLAQLTFGGFGGGGDQCSSKPDRPMVAYYGEQEFSSGETAHITSLRGEYGPLQGGKGITVFPSICVNERDLVNAATAVSPNGVEIQPYPGPFPDESDWGEVWLPLEAFSEPGLWHLVIDAPNRYFDLRIEVPPIREPTHLDDGKRLWLGGFDPNERIIGVTIGAAGPEGAFDLQADSRGNGLVINPFDCLNTFIFVGENEHVSCYFYCSELSQTLHDYYWHGGSGNTVQQTASSACPEALSPRLSIGGQARVTFTDGTPLRVRRQPSKSAEIIYRMPEGTSLSIITGPICAEGWIWWEIQTEDGLAGWAAEGDSQAGYWLEPLP